ncbi:ABC transporter permease [Bradyrhizobium guangzhouense]|nr:ABC transporter permease [Bradyrhizobium guangzhouense]
MLSSEVAQKTGVVCSIGGGLLLWEIASLLSHTALLPSPVEVVATAEKMGLWVILVHAAASISRILVGFVAGSTLAIVVGLLMGWYGLFRAATDPWIQFFRAVPPLALIPLVTLLLGINELPKYVVIGLAAFLPVTVAVAQGVLDVDSGLINVARVLGSSQARIFRSVVIPAASPVIMIGLRIGLGNCWGTLVAAELIASRSGLGYMTSQGAMYFDVPEIFLGIVLIGVCGIIMDRMLHAVQQHVTAWQERR